jgi:tetratricopeptide (TPR) repeat protein
MADNRPAQAIKLLEKSLALYPAPATRYLLGQCFEALGKRAQAAAEYARVEPAVATALAARLLAQSVDRMAAGQHAAAARLLDRSLLLRPSAKGLFLSLGLCR